jgi:prepilin-type N-terminal cleavage/methylation domain-containing protein
MKRNNRGFTLTELIVTVAIFGVVIIGVYAFMFSGARSYRSVSTLVNLQTTAQHVTSQVQENALDCNRGICTQNDTALYLLEQDTAGIYTIRAYTLDATGGKLYYQEVSGVNNATEAQSILDAQKHFLAENVTAFQPEQKVINTKSNTLTIQVKFQRDGKQYPATQTVALRNTPTSCATLEELIELAQ